MTVLSNPKKERRKNNQTLKVDRNCGIIMIGWESVRDDDV
jgi:hypothetical protein